MQKFSLAVAAAVVVLLSACGPKTESTPAATASAPEVVAVAPVVAEAPENTLGKSVYNKTCAMCHAAGVAGAPKPGDKADWAPRIAQGMDILFKHATEGYTGAKGMMPARGANPALTDDEMKAAISYMVDKSR